MTTAAERFIAARDFLIAHRADQHAACAGFSWPQLEHFNWALDYFDDLARGNERSALIIAEENGSHARYSFADLYRRSNRVANYLRTLSVRRGDRVLLMLGNQIELWEAMLALTKLGAVIIPTTTLLDVGDLHDRIERGGVSHVICASEVIDRFADTPDRVTRIVTGEASGWHRFSDAEACCDDFTPEGETLATDPLLLYFTSGTASKPKPVLHTHQSYPIGHLSTMYWIGLQPADVHMNISSPGWAKHAWSNFFAPWNGGAAIFVYNYTRFRAPEVLRQIVEHGVTTMCAPPTVWRILIQEDLGRWPVKLREIVGAGEPLNPEVIEQVRAAWGLTIRDGFGQSETTCQIGNAPGQPVKIGSMGRPLPGYLVILLGPDGQPGDEGELCLDLTDRPVGLMAGYDGDEEKTRNVMRDGLYRTGDIAVRDADGYITYVGRADDVFKCSDYRLSPFELESALMEHPDVAEAAVVPSPDARRLAVPKAFITLRTGLEPSREVALSILRHARDHLAPYKRIRRVEIAELPKTISGKIQRAQLRRLEEERSAQGLPIATEYREEDFPELAR